MFYGQWDTTIDEKWRLSLPNYINGHFQNFVMLKEGKVCLEIYKAKTGEKIERIDSPFIFFQRIKNKGFVVPKIFRDSVSFYFGKRVTLAGRGSYLEIWPRP